MKDLISKFEALWVSIAFAEAGEHEISQQVLSQDRAVCLDRETCPAL